MVYTLRKGDTRKNAFRENVDCFALFIWKRKEGKERKGKNFGSSILLSAEIAVSRDVHHRLGQIGDGAGKGTRSEPKAC
jgi:hypothetical protein